MFAIVTNFEIFLIENYSMNKQLVVAQVDKPLDEILEAVMQLDGNILLLIPQRDL